MGARVSWSMIWDALSDGAFAITSNRAVFAQDGTPVSWSLLLILKARVIRNCNGMPPTFNRPPGCIWNLETLESGLAVLTVATSNSVGAGIAGSASAVPGGFSLGFWLTLSTTRTGVGICLSSSFKP